MVRACLTLASLLLLLFFSFAAAAGDFEFQISPSFRNCKPSDSKINYFDYCGFDCTKYPGVTVKNAADFCTACRTTVAALGPYCYENKQCPALFNSGKAKSDIHLRWGAPFDTAGMSGMGFSPVKDTQVGLGGTFNVQKEFKLGDLTHYNWPVASGTTAQSFDFVMTISITRQGITYLFPTEITFSLVVDETPNNWRVSPCSYEPCPDPSRGCTNTKCPYTSRLPCGRTNPGCPDQISFVNQLVSNLTFTLSDGVNYTFAIIGFREVEGGPIYKDFKSDEEMSSTVGIYAVVTRACPDCAKAGTKSVFNQTTFTCQCECDKDAVKCKAPETLLPDCTCGCPQDKCQPGEKAMLVNGKCGCVCDTITVKECPKGFVPAACNETVGNGCCCVCKENCGSSECYNSTCEVVNGQTVCKIDSFDGKACGQAMDLCSDRCLDKICTPFDLTVVSARCSTPPPECGPCCTYACDKKTGKCVMTWSKDNDTCSDNDACTANDRCVPNPGNTTVPLVCKGEPKCSVKLLGKTSSPCTEWQCSTARFADCIEVPLNQTGVTCGALGFCSENGTCSPAGECVRPRKQCNSPDPCVVGRCREDLSQCEFVRDLANGLPCDDGDNCTSGDVCVEGQCQGSKACNSTPPGGIPLVPLIVTAAVVAAAALVAGFFVYQAIGSANIMDPVSWGEVNSSQFDANPLYKEATQFGDNPLYQS